MKKNYFSFKTLVAALCLFGLSANAQIFSVVGSGTTWNDQYTYPAPYGNWYGGCRTNLFVTAAELTAAGIAGGAQISSIGFNIQGLNGAAAHQGWHMKVYTTANNDPIASAFFVGTPVANSPTATATGTIGWNQTTFITPFIWNGSDNLVIETCFDNQSYTYNYSTYWETSLSGSAMKSRWRNQDYAPNVCGDPSYNQSTTNRPNMRFEWISPTPCSTQPAANSILTPTYQICPNSSVNIGLANSYTVGGITYQWYSSTTSSVGPFTAVPSATSPVLSTPNLTVGTWYTSVITCTNAVGSTTATAGQVSVSPVIVDVVPYYESFEGIIGNDKLPNCSWAASNLGSTCKTYISSNTAGRTPRTGSKFASFYYSPGGTNYFYTNGIQLDAGVTYSASVWYQTEYYGYNNWTDLSIMYGTSQTPTGLISIASTNGPAISNVHKSLSNTFTVATSGVYYVAIRGTGTTGSSAQYLSWDDLSIIVPCTDGSPNKPTLTLNANTTSVCAGQPVNLTVSGADTYTWSNNSNGNLLTDMPNINTNYMVVGTNTLTGCTDTISQAITVLPSPEVYAISDKASVCAGSPVILTGLGAVTYTWSNGALTNMTTVSPTISTSYTVLGSNAFGCTSQAVKMINVNSLPTVGTNVSAATICLNEVISLSGTGATTYMWYSNTSPNVYQGSSIAVSPNATTTFTIVGTDGNGCSGSANAVVTVDACTGINKFTASNSGVNVFPNPTGGMITVETHNTSVKTVELVDLSGRVLVSTTSSLENVQVNMNSFANGVYYVKIQSGSTTDVVKVVKE